MENKLEKRKLEEFEQTRPQELVLFEFLTPENKYSNSIELYDFIPKYYWGKMERLKVENHKKEVLLILEREFECRNKKYKVQIIPATLIDEDGIEKDYYPTSREELVEDALRKLACEGKGLFLDDEAGVVFSLYELQQELKSTHHTFSISEIKKALLICKGVTVVVITEDNKTIVASNIFETLGLQTWEDWKGHGKKTKGFVRFNPLVTRAIKNKTFRQIDYKKSMSYKNVIARQLHKRISHHYIQASLVHPYSILLTTIIRDFGLTKYRSLDMNLRDAKLALEEMKEKEVILEYKIEKKLDGQKRNKLVDVKLLITPHPTFSNEMRTANTKYREINSIKA